MVFFTAKKVGEQTDYGRVVITRLGPISADAKKSNLGRKGKIVFCKKKIRSGVTLVEPNNCGNLESEGLRGRVGDGGGQVRMNQQATERNMRRRGWNDQYKGGKLK